MGDRDALPDDPPNILFLFPDQLRWDWIGVEGAVPVRTPNIDALAERGTRFTHVYCNSPLCAPSRASLATGLRPHRTGVRDNKQDTDPDALTCFELLRNAGYRVGTTGKCDLHKCSDDFSTSGWRPRLGRYGFTEAVDQGGKHNGRLLGFPTPHDPHTAHLHATGLAPAYLEDAQKRMALRRDHQAQADWPSPLPRRSYTDDFTGAASLELLDRFPLHASWCLWVNFPGPHEPFDPPRDLQARYDSVDFDPPVNNHETQNNHAQVRRNYAAMISGIDDWVGWLIDAVERRGELDRTVVVFASDHGEMLGDHDCWYKKLPWEGSTRVPLIVAGPGIDAGQTRDDLVELVDLAATLPELAGITAPEHWDSRSLVPLLRGETGAELHRDVATSIMLGEWRMITDGHWKLIDWLQQERELELYDLHADPSELINRASQQPEIVGQLQNQLQREQPWV